MITHTQTLGSPTRSPTAGMITHTQTQLNKDHVAKLLPTFRVEFRSDICTDIYTSGTVKNQPYNHIMVYQITSMSHAFRAITQGVSKAGNSSYLSLRIYLYGTSVTRIAIIDSPCVQTLLILTWARYTFSVHLYSLRLTATRSCSSSVLLRAAGHGILTQIGHFMEHFCVNWDCLESSRKMQCLHTHTYTTHTDTLSHVTSPVYTTQWAIQLTT